MAVTVEKVSTEIYGFVAWVTTWVLLIAFLAWEIVPSRDFVRSHACTAGEKGCIADAIRAEVPDQHWALAVPALLISLVVFIVLAYWSTVFRTTPPLDSPAAHSSARAPSARKRSVVGTIPQIEDVPLEIVTRLLFERRSRR